MKEQWGYNIAHESRQKHFRVIHRFLQKHSIVYDASYYQKYTIEGNGQQKASEYIKKRYKWKHIEGNQGLIEYENSDIPIRILEQPNQITLIVHPLLKTLKQQLIEDLPEQYILKDETYNYGLFEIRGKHAKTTSQHLPFETQKSESILNGVDLLVPIKHTAQLWDCIVKRPHVLSIGLLDRTHLLNDKLYVDTEVSLKAQKRRILEVNFPFGRLKEATIVYLPENENEATSWWNNHKQTLHGTLSKRPAFLNLHKPIYSLSKGHYMAWGFVEQPIDHLKGPQMIM
eukprot:CAMPEP_0117425292 /NCGR_PEP_ID=MMETSP0758-20121206/5582_1 /TAXON_ID=63605 /ORGANISM="Percolomonas cosmopolitus, Strain AE-1 (ATCC 50343)" /LENGTH=285 /DNA_ID=CAMNT_0005209667 /DNA_START=429 /DNA_END=1283 /DNA_ORIENTATION=-